jgi:hypothetical protein
MINYMILNNLQINIIDKNNLFNFNEMSLLNLFDNSNKKYFILFC